MEFTLKKQKIPKISPNFFWDKKSTKFVGKKTLLKKGRLGKGGIFWFKLMIWNFRTK
jgi:hypothetical protein